MVLDVAPVGRDVTYALLGRLLRRTCLRRVLWTDRVDDPESIGNRILDQPGIILISFTSRSKNLRLVTTLTKLAVAFTSPPNEPGNSLVQM